MRSFNLPVPGWQRFLARFYLGFRKPKRPILGIELAGEIEEVGKEVTLFKKGDEVFAGSVFSGFGGYAEYICLPEDGWLALKPSNVPFEKAAPLAGGALTALGMLRKGSIEQRQKVLIYGASGSVGTYAVQLAKYYGAHVTGVCSGANCELILSLSADRTIDYTKEDFTENGEQYDLIFDAVGKLTGSNYKNSLAKNGKYLDVVKHSSSGDVKKKDLVFLKELCEQEKLHTVVDRQYTFEEIVEAHSYVEKGHKRGNVVIQIV